MGTAAELQMQVTEQTIAWAHDHVGLSYAEVAQALDTDERTIRRWVHHESVPRVMSQDRLEQLREIRYLLDSCFRTPELGIAWLHHSVPALRGRTPVSRLRAGDFDAVLGVLATMESGAFV
jgi:hypothetical protein